MGPMYHVLNPKWQHSYFSVQNYYEAQPSQYIVLSSCYETIHDATYMIDNHRGATILGTTANGRLTSSRWEQHLCRGEILTIHWRPNSCESFCQTHGWDCPHCQQSWQLKLNVTSRSTLQETNRKIQWVILGMGTAPMLFYRCRTIRLIVKHK